MKTLKPVRIRNFKQISGWLCFFLILSSSISAAPSPEDLQLLHQIEADTIKYFIRLSDKNSGLTHDSSRPGSPASTAATGFALAAIAIGQSRGWIPADRAEQQIRKTLQTLLDQAQHKNGFFYHFLDARTGRRIWASEASSIDTALLIAGALVAAQYYPRTDIEKMAHQIYERVDWRWMMNQSPLICMGWKPETGFLPYYWDSYSELIILQALAIGSPTHPIPVKAWQEWERKEDIYNQKSIVYSFSGSLFTYQFSQAFIDFSNLDDRGINYFQNSRLATIANREYSLSFQQEHSSYSENSWGLSASLGPGGYKAYGAKPGQGLQDGTVAPYAVIGSLPFTPEESVSAIRFLHQNYRSNLYGIFGFKDAFNLEKHWWAEEYLGIDQGISVLMLENFLNEGVVWKKFSGLDSIQRWERVCRLIASRNRGSGSPKITPVS